MKTRNAQPMRSAPEISGTLSQPSSEASQARTLTEPAEQPSAGPTEAMQLKDENEQRGDHAERRGFGGASSQSLSKASQVTTLTEFVKQSTAPDPTKVIQLEDENEEPAADGERRGGGETPSQPISEASQVPTL